MRVLVVLAHVPTPEGAAAGRTGIGLLRGLRAHGLDVTAVAASVGGPSSAAPPSDLDVEVIEVDHERGWRGRAIRYGDPLSMLGRGAFSERVRQLSAGADVVHLEEVSSAPAGRSLGVPVAVHVHCLARRDRTWSAPWTREARDFLELARAEARARRRTRWLIANSPEVAADLRGGGDRDVAVVPLALDPGDYVPAPGPSPPVAGLIGSAAWPPTANSVERLLGDVWPRVIERRPDSRLRLAGWGMTRETFHRLPDLPGVEWVGPVPSAKDFLRSLGVLLYPLGRGSGTKVKVLEAMALGIPVVTTPPGAEGLADGLGVSVETSDARLAAVTAELLRDEPGRSEQGAAALAQFERDHSPAAAAAPLIELYRRMLR